MENFDLGYIREAIAKGKKLVEVICVQKVNELQSAHVKKMLPAKTVLRNLSNPNRKGGWRQIVPINFVKGADVPAVPLKLDQNSLSDPKLLEQLSDLGFVRVEDLPVMTELKEDKGIAPQMTDEEMLEYLKSKGAVSGNVKLKTDSENA